MYTEFEFTESTALAAQIYDEMGLEFLPVAKGTKKPTTKDYLTQKYSQENISDEIDIGLKGGGENNDVYIDFDLSVELMEIVEKIMPKTNMIEGRKSSPRSHWGFRIMNFPVDSNTYLPSPGSQVRTAMETGKIKKFFGKRHYKRPDGYGFDVIGASGFICAPPSTHSSGEVREWDSFGEPTALDFDELLSLCDKLADALGCSKQTTPLEDSPIEIIPREKPPFEEVKKLAIKFIKAHDVSIDGDGGNVILMKVCIKLFWGYALSIDDSLDILMEHWNDNCEPPWEESEIKKALISASKFNGYEHGFYLPTKSVYLTAEEYKSIDMGIDILSEYAVLNKNIFIKNEKPVILKASGESQNNGLKISPLVKQHLRYIITKIADIKGYTKNSDEVSKHPPDWFLEGILNHGHWPKIPVLKYVADHPMVLPDGRMITKQGFDVKSGILMLCTTTGIDTPDETCQKDAQSAYKKLRKIFVDFPFKKEKHFATFLSMMLTPLIRPFIDGPTPMHLVNGNAPGVGKGLLVDVASIIVSGYITGKAAMPKDREEMRKLITSYLIKAVTRVCFDNAHELGNDVLDKALTDRVWEDRILGKSESISYQLLLTWICTGNNIQIKGDMGRRTIQVELISELEHPEKRNDYTIPDIQGYVAENRSKILSNLMIILKEGLRANSELCFKKMPILGSYEKWSRLVANGIIWAGGGNCIETTPDESNDEERSNFSSVVHALIDREQWLHKHDQYKPFTAKEIVDETEGEPDQSEIYEAIRSFDGFRSFDSATVSKVLRKIENRICDNHKVVRETVRETVRKNNTTCFRLQKCK